MNLTLWRKYVTKTWHGGWADLNNEEILWTTIKKRVRKYSDEEKRHCNHPDVRNHLGFWTNDTTLVMGYALLSKPDIIRPIWSYKREQDVKKVLNQLIKIYPNCFSHEVVKEKVSNAFVVKSLPTELVRKIINYIC
jgi:hypothetical protein|tara:strand:- start:13 stop:420 length:408 start_codon:yes stop_codon:yes gene_type:complete